MGRGALALKGSKRRPWLELRRCETERTYLDHQLRRLRKLHDGPIEAQWDRIPSEGFYDKVRLRLHGEDLYRVYELLYPRDEKRINKQVLTIAGFDGLIALWADNGRWWGRIGRIDGRYNTDEFTALQEWIEELGVQCYLSNMNSEGDRPSLRFKDIGARQLQAVLRENIHPSLRSKIKPADTSR